METNRAKFVIFFIMVLFFFLFLFYANFLRFSEQQYTSFRSVAHTRLL